MIKFLIVIALAIPIGIATGLFVPRLMAQEEPPQLGHGAVSRVEIIESTKCSAEINLIMGARSRTMSLNLPPGQCNQKTGEEIAAQATAELQQAIDFCVPINTLPDDDPDRFTDPARPDLHWRGLDLCSVPVIVTVVWDPITESYSISWRSSNA